MLLKIKYSFLMPYYKRASQLHNTLVSLSHFYEKRDDWEIVLVEDLKNRQDKEQHDKFIELVEGFTSACIAAIEASRQASNPSFMFNEAAHVALGEYLILTNPECFHKADVLGGLDKEFVNNPNAYVVCGCEAGTDCSEYIRSFKEFSYRHKVWYQHSKHRNAGYHFCSALSKQSFNQIGGFDERFADGIAYDDNDFREKIKQFGLPFVYRDDLLVVHQDHSKFGREIGRGEYRHKLQRNRRLYEQKWGQIR